MSLLQKVTDIIGHERYSVKVEADNFKELIEELISRQHDSYYPDGSLQCLASKTRSIIDVARIVLNHFPETSIEEIIRYIAEGLFRNTMHSLFCPQIVRQTITHGEIPAGYGYHRGFSSAYSSPNEVRDLLEQYQNDLS